MTEIGKVTKIEGDLVTVHCKPSAACHSCNSGMCNVKDREILTRNPGKLPLRTGDYAEIFLPSGQAVKAGLQVFVLPLILFIAFYLGMQKGFGIDREGPLVLSGLAGLALGFLISFFLGRKNRTLPEIVRAVADNELPGLLPEEYPNPAGMN